MERTYDLYPSLPSWQRGFVFWLWEESADTKSDLFKEKIAPVLPGNDDCELPDGLAELQVNFLRALARRKSF
jgi:hypothetical protein